MEPAPLTQAHAHAHAAFSLQSQVANLSSASEEHALAAGEFAQAAKSTGDAEAMRTLRLLEQHHQKLHEILKFRSSHPVPSKSSTETSAIKAEEDATGTITSSPSEGSKAKSVRDDAAAVRRTSSPNQRPPSTTRTASGRVPARDLTSSIASNLASARGIPSHQRRRAAPASPTLSAQHAGGKNASTDGRHREGRGYRGSVPSAAKTASGPTVSPKKHGATSEAIASASRPAGGSSPPAQDEPFQRFYSTFETLLSKLSAPLAFAGLPLSPDDPPPPPRAEPRGDRATATNEPDLRGIFSRAALQAVRDTGNGPLHGAGGESFYVVPASGGTISYAGILSRAEQERRLAAGGGGASSLSAEGDDEFVDAREMPGPPSPDLRRAGGGSSSTVGAKTMEELQLENQALKQLSDTLSKRLHMWEVNAQSSSLALQQSLRVMQQHGSSAGTSQTTAAAAAAAAGEAGSPEVSEAGAAEEKRELEERLAAATREITKLKEVIARYRSKWEKLKEGARARREGGPDGREHGDRGSMEGK